MRSCITLVFCCVLCILLYVTAVDAAPSPTLRVSIEAASSEDRTLLEDVFSERIATMPLWSAQFGVPLANAPCMPGGPRAELRIDLGVPVDHMRQAQVALLDCAAWPIEAWSFTVPTGTFGVRLLVGQTIFALRQWQHHEPVRFAALFDTGDAEARDGRCRSELSFVKTSDGRLRAIVRAGGPAYASGIRTNDAVMRIDGRYWWEYGTYRSQQIANDGQAHLYTLSHSEKEYRVSCMSANSGSL